MNGWIKYFAFGEPEYGQDKDILRKKASWSKGRLENMIGAEVYHNNFRVIKISGPGQYHQSDDFEISMLKSIPVHKVRRLQKKIKEQDVFIVGDITENKTISLFTAPEDIIFSDKNYSIFCGLPKNAFNEWLTVEYDIKHNEVSMFLSKDKI